MMIFSLAVCLAFISPVICNAINQTILATPTTVKLSSSLEVKDDKVVNTLKQFSAPKELSSGQHKNTMATAATLDQELFSEGGKETVHKNKSIVPRKGVEYPKAEEASPQPSNDVLASNTNSTTELKHENQILKTVTSTNVPNVTLTTSKAIANLTEVPQNLTLSSTTTSTTTTTTTSTTTTTTTTTTARPKKPQVVLSPQDDPSLLNVPEFKKPTIVIPNPSNKFMVDEPSPPIAQATKEYLSQTDSSDGTGHREYIVPVILFIFAIPMLLGTIVISYRRFKDWWLTRHYRRMDFLVDGMYND